MIQQVLNSQKRQGSFNSASVEIPAGATVAIGRATMTDVRILDPDVQLRITLAVSRDGGVNWDSGVSAEWEGGPQNQPKVPGNPLPRPSSGSLDVSELAGTGALLRTTVDTMQSAASFAFGSEIEVD